MSILDDASQSGQIVHDSFTIKKINSLLNSSKTRSRGLELLNAYLPHCCDEDFTEFCVNWMQNCCKVDGLIKNSTFGIELLCRLLKMSSDYPELKKSVSFFITTRYFDYFFKYLLNSQAGWSCTETCFLLYRGACGSFQESFEKYLTKQVGRNIKIPSTVARCFAFFPCLGGGGSDGTTYRNNWRSQFHKFLNLSHSVLNDLFVNVEEFQEYDSSGYACGKRESTSPPTLLIQLHNHCCVLKFMLLNQYPAVKSIPTDLTLQLICRGLAVNPKSQGSHQTADVVALQKILPDIHDILFSLLKALIATCRTQLLPYSQLICKLVKQTLEWTTSDCSYGSEKPFGLLRISAYETLGNWLAATRNGSCIETISSTIISSAVSDVTCEKEVVLLKEVKQKKKFKGNRQSKRRLDHSANSSLCRAALQALKYLVRFAGILLKAEEQKFLQEVVVKLISDIQNKAFSDMIIPFSVSTCRKELYSVLLELVHHPCPNWLPPTNFALRLFTRGENDWCPDVSQFCSMGVSYLTAIIHPHFDNGGFLNNDAPSGRSRHEAAPEYMEPMQVEPTVRVEKGNTLFNKNDAESEENSLAEEQIVSREPINKESDVSSDEDSTNTLPFLAAAEVPDANNVKILESKDHELKDENTERVSPEIREGDELVFKKNKIKEGDQASEKTLSLLEEVDTAENDACKGAKFAEDSMSAKSISPESTNEEGPKKRYFLRSKTCKASSEEPEEVLKRTSSPESVRNTPSRGMIRGTLSVPSSKRPRTRARLKTVESETESTPPKKIGRDEDENIIETFNDSFLD